MLPKPLSCTAVHHVTEIQTMTSKIRISYNHNLSEPDILLATDALVHTDLTRVIVCVEMTILYVVLKETTLDEVSDALIRVWIH